MILPSPLGVQGGELLLSPATAFQSRGVFQIPALSGVDKDLAVIEGPAISFLPAAAGIPATTSFNAYGALSQSEHIQPSLSGSGSELHTRPTDKKSIDSPHLTRSNSYHPSDQLHSSRDMRLNYRSDPMSLQQQYLCHKHHHHICLSRTK
jgi:hypothetical protein